MKTLFIVAILLASAGSTYATPQKEWFLMFDARFCDVHDCGERQPPVDYVYKDTYTTRKECLAAGRHLIANKTAALYIAAYNDDPLGKISSRCELYDGIN